MATTLTGSGIMNPPLGWQGSSFHTWMVSPNMIFTCEFGTLNCGPNCTDPENCPMCSLMPSAQKEEEGEEEPEQSARTHSGPAQR